MRSNIDFSFLINFIIHSFLYQILCNVGVEYIFDPFLLVHHRQVEDGRGIYDLGWELIQFLELFLENIALPNNCLDIDFFKFKAIS